MQIEALTREFRYNGARLADPSPEFSLQQVRDFYGNTYPEIVNAEIEGPEVVANRNVYTFRRAVGTKGASVTLVELREALLRGGLSGSDSPSVDEADLTSSGHALYRIATWRAAGPRLLLPLTHMPVLP